MPARFASTVPTTNPRLQGRSFFYVVPTRDRTLLPGMDAAALLPVGQAAEGVVVPRIAVIWWDGFTWAYSQEGVTEFVRRQVSTEQPIQKRLV